jgi:cytoskeletal protein RodZ
MSKLKKLVVTVGALAALAVGGAAFAQAQNAATPITAPTHQSVGEETSSGDTDGVQASQDSASGQNEAADSASRADTPDGPTEPADQGSQED